MLATRETTNRAAKPIASGNEPTKTPGGDRVGVSLQRKPLTWTSLQIPGSGVEWVKREAMLWSAGAMAPEYHSLANLECAGMFASDPTLQNPPFPISFPKDLL